METVKIGATLYFVAFALVVGVALDEDYDINLHLRQELTFATQGQRDAAAETMRGLLEGEYRGHPGSIEVVANPVPTLLLAEGGTVPEDFDAAQWLWSQTMEAVFDAAGVLGHADGVWVYQCCKDDQAWSENWADTAPGTNYDDTGLIERSQIEEEEDETEADAIARYIRNGWITEDDGLKAPALA